MTFTEIPLHQRMQNALQYIQNSLDEALDPEKIAAQAHYSLSHFHRIFKGMFGETLGEHVRRLRLERAAQQLVYSDKSITIIAFDAGYETLESFSRAFKNIFQDSPSKYRVNKRELRFPDSPSGIHYDPAKLPGLPEVKKDPELEFRFETIKPIRIAFVRHVGPYMECVKAWERLCGWAAPKGILHEESMFLGICYDDPSITPAGKVRYEACIDIPAHTDPENEVAVKTIAGGEYAVFTHNGPYERLEETYIRICGHWLPVTDRKILNQPSIEHYITNPEVTASEDLITDIYIPLA